MAARASTSRSSWGGPAGAVVVGAVLGGVLGVAQAGPAGDGYLARLAARVRARLDEIVAQHPAKLVPPRPIAVRWKAAKIGSLDLRAPLVALTAADLDGDRRGELYAVTSREVVVVQLRANKLTELVRIAFAGDPAVPASRDPVGTAVVDGGAVVAASSAWARELRIAWAGNAPAGTPGEAGFLRCPGERAQLVAGRNYFDDGSFAVRCRGDLVDAQGHPLRVRAQLAQATNRLAVVVERCAAAGDGCRPAGTFSYTSVGTAFDIADVDRDGTPEIIAAGAGAPGDPDLVKVIALGSDDRQGVFRRTFRGGVAGVVTVDTTGTGVAEVIAVVRLAGATRVDLWRLN